MADGKLLEISYERELDGIKTTYRHIAPPCSSFKVSYADVDKEGSGRNALTGEMFRERIGSYCKIDLTWDLIPNTQNYNNWYLILSNLPPFFNAHVLMPNGVIETKKMYRTDISTSLYLFTSNAQIWQGLSTSFVQWDVIQYNDSSEPRIRWTIIKDTTNGIQTKEVSSEELNQHLEEGWRLA